MYEFYQAKTEEERSDALGTVGIDRNKDIQATLNVADDKTATLTFQQTYDNSEGVPTLYTIQPSDLFECSRIVSVEKIEIEGDEPVPGESSYKRGAVPAGVIALAALVVLGGLYMTRCWPFQAQKI